MNSVEHHQQHKILSALLRDISELIDTSGFLLILSLLAFLVQKAKDALIKALLFVFFFFKQT